MSLRERVLSAVITLPNGQIVNLDQDLKLRVRIKKAALALQNKATIEVTNLTTSLREQLLSQFTAWQRRQNEQGTNTGSWQWVNVEVIAGYTQNGVTRSATVFKGQIVQVDPVAGPPNVTVRITAYTRQVDKTNFITVNKSPPAEAKFKDYVKWAAEEMGYGNQYLCQTSYDEVVVKNPARSLLTHSALLIDIQDMYKPDVAAFVDDDFLYVKDRNKIVNTDAITQVTDFIGIPQWTEWGVQFTTLFDQSIRLAQASSLNSLLNPFVNGTYVIMELQYELSSREGPFYVTANGSPPA